MAMTLDPTNPVVALCAAGMAVEGTPAEARGYFEQAWAARRDDYEAAIAAHFLARHQASAADTLHWNVLAVRHAEAVGDGRVAGFMASLYLNLGDAQANVGDVANAATSVRRAADHLAAVPAGGYREFVAFGIRRLAARLDRTGSDSAERGQTRPKARRTGSDSAGNGTIPGNGGSMKTNIGIAWYEPDEWPRLRAVAPDADQLEATHAEWLVVAEQGLADLRAAGYRPHRVPVKIAALEAWCEVLGRRPDASARAEYTSTELRRLYQAGLLDPEA